ncbi:hypothetical protein L6452_38943 [Arctium lappa]|uniref:Uncharacterized protein n=1 Tax=Arctium lappa TaxID=4217 RepID=A0ACB8XV17_ARCLA|nr:hypothetical protein L6452_38943 [Arctium lappa]
MENTSEASTSNSEVVKLTSVVFELRATLNSNNNIIEALEKLVIGNSSVLSKDIANTKEEVLKANPAPSAPSVTSKDFSNFKGEMLKILEESIAKISIQVAAPSTTLQP